MASIKAKDISYLMQNALNTNLSYEKKQMFEAIDIAHKDMAEIQDWKKLRLRKSLSFTGADLAIPTNAIGVTGVRSATTVYYKTEEEDILSLDDRPHWYYASQVADNPSVNKFINIIDDAGDAATDAVNVYYWAYPPTITGANDDILVPGPKALAMASIMVLLGFIEHKPAQAEPFRIEYNEALKELQLRYPVTSRSKAPKGRHGNRLAMGDLG